jgi:hypothetical protein
MKSKVNQDTKNSFLIPNRQAIDLVPGNLIPQDIIF